MAFEPNPPRTVPVQNVDLNTSLITPVKHIDQCISTPETGKNQPQSQLPIGSPTPSNTNISYFDPSAVSTPAKPNFNNSHISPATQQQRHQSFDSFNSTLLAINESSTQYSYPAYSISPLETKSPVITFTTNQNAMPNNSTMTYSSILITTPCESITTPAMPATVISSIQIDNSNNQITQLNRQIQGGPAPKRAGCRAKRSRFKSAAYKELEHLDPNMIRPRVSWTNSLVRFRNYFGLDSKMCFFTFSTFIHQMNGASLMNNVKF